MERYKPTKIFYVYEHWRPDKDVCFYVGKGKDDRAWRKRKSRNIYYMRVVNKLERLGMCVEVRMVQSGLIEFAALALEVERIVFWRSQGVQLANLTDGGEGVSGLKHKAKTKRILRAKSKAAALRIAADPEAKAQRSKRSSESATKYFADPEARKNHGKAMTEIMRDPKVRNARSKSMTRIMKDPEVRLGRSQKQILVMADLSERIRRGALIKESWQDPVIRLNRTESMKATWKDPEIAASRSKGIKKALANDPERLAQYADTMRKRMSDPVYVAYLHECKRKKKRANLILEIAE